MVFQGEDQTFIRKIIWENFEYEKMFKMINSTTLVKELFSKTNPTRFQEESEIYPKTRIFLPS
jgi:hypothetical protein